MTHAYQERTEMTYSLHAEGTSTTLPTETILNASSTTLGLIPLGAAKWTDGYEGSSRETPAPWKATIHGHAPLGISRHAEMGLVKAAGIALFVRLQHYGCTKVTEDNSKKLVAMLDDDYGVLYG